MHSRRKIKTMTPKEKAEELIQKYLKMNDGLIEEFIPIPKEGAKQCALVAVNEILQSHYALLTGIKPSTYNYWQEVKTEIEKL